MSRRVRPNSRLRCSPRNRNSSYVAFVMVAPAPFDSAQGRLLPAVPRATRPRRWGRVVPTTAGGVPLHFLANISGCYYPLPFQLSVLILTLNDETHIHPPLPT